MADAPDPAGLSSSVARARACCLRRFRFSLSFVANLRSRAAFSSALVMVRDRGIFALRRKKAYGIYRQLFKRRPPAMLQ